MVEYQKDKLNQSDYLSRHAKDFSLIPDVQQKEADEFSNLLYTLHTTPVVDHISLARISKQTETDEVLSKLAEIIRKGSLDVGRNQDASLKKFKPILSELSLTGNGIILKGERMVLPESLQGMAIELAHRGSHPGRAGIERRLRYHFFFHGMYDKVKNFVEKCEECCLFVDKKTKEPIQHHNIPRKAWETVAVDLFGPMPSSRHVVVVQDIGSRFPAAKLVSSTKADKVIPILDEIYTEYGYPDTQISDNGPPFNSIKMRQYNESHGIAAQFSTPYTPSQNPAETFMKTVGKAMKIANHSRENETKALRDALITYRQTPHISTGIPPSNIGFRDGIKTEFPRKSATQSELKDSRMRDEAMKGSRQDNVNSSKYRKHTSVAPGDVVLTRNFGKTSKFDPLFRPEPYMVISCDEEASRVWLENLTDSKVVIRHLDDVKECHTELDVSGLDQYGNDPVVDQEASGSDLLEEHEGTGSDPDEVIFPRRSTRAHRGPARYPEGEWTS